VLQQKKRQAFSAVLPLAHSKTCITWPFRIVTASARLQFFAITIENNPSQKT
jgi:hypothetical protein